MRGAPLLLALAGGGSAWILHLLAGYFLVSLGCPRGWPALGGTLAAVTGVCAAGALAVAGLALRERGRIPRGRADGETARLLLGVAVLLGALFAVMIVLGGVTVAALPPCQAAVGG
jgi:hypothetical protein